MKIQSHNKCHQLECHQNGSAVINGLRFTFEAGVPTAHNVDERTATLFRDVDGYVFLHDDGALAGTSANRTSGYGSIAQGTLTPIDASPSSLESLERSLRSGELSLEQLQALVARHSAPDGGRTLILPAGFNAPSAGSSATPTQNAAQDIIPRNDVQTNAFAQAFQALPAPSEVSEVQVLEELDESDELSEEEPSTDEGKPADSSTPESGKDDGGDFKDDPLASLTNSQLKTQLADKGIPFDARANKASLIEALKGA